jgi:hypothetical protein
MIYKTHSTPHYLYTSICYSQQKVGVSVEVFSTICCFCVFVYFITEVLILLPSTVLLHCPMHLNTNQMINPEIGSRSHWPVIILP